MGNVIEGAALAEALAAVKAYARIEGASEDAVLGVMTASAAALCEAFTGQWLVARDGSETMAGEAGWRRLSATPVNAILGVVDRDGEALPTGDYEIDIDAAGDGWVRVTNGVKTVRITFRAGIAATWTEVPEALRQGIVRLAAHLYAARDTGDGQGPPAAVTALWRPWRRMPFGRCA
ncbi:hypothetical protein IC614_05795 [Allosphingosinicella flava]|uniref:Phage gp6-like head-tail connector protein n=1 Tax=Allosphingosinicella flava TaxID=2771430 RepID=A0A7T2LN05_9SPHN|nr:hypothetical protein [Sphingosinicella flava]QPQ56081.1 hypothetical protein IC614_05795 [Sphingosinicella flava]